MKLHVWIAIIGLGGLAQGVIRAQQPTGVAETLRHLASEPATHTEFTFDKNTLQYANGYLEDNSGGVAGLDSITVENYRYPEPATYIPERMNTLMAEYRAAGWQYVANRKPVPSDSAVPAKPPTDLWLHSNGESFDKVVVLIRAPKQMDVIEISGKLKIFDLIHLSGHFGIPKIDPDAVTMPEPPAPPAEEDEVSAKSRSVPPHQEARAFVRAVRNWLRQSLQRARAAGRA